MYKNYTRNIASSVVSERQWTDQLISTKQRSVWRVRTYAVSSVSYLIVNFMWGGVSFAPTTEDYSFLKISSLLISFIIILLEIFHPRGLGTSGCKRLGVLVLASLAMGISGRIIYDSEMSLVSVTLGVLLLLGSILVTMLCISRYSKLLN